MSLKLSLVFVTGKHKFSTPADEILCDSSELLTKISLVTYNFAVQ